MIFHKSISDSCLYFLWFTLLLFGCSRKDIPKKERILIDKMESKESSVVFPNDWLGYWEGEVEIHDVNGITQKLPIALDHQKTDTLGTYLWAIIYGEDTIAGRRQYYLKEVPDEKGHYIVDEKNTILLDHYYINGHLFSQFEVKGTHITSMMYKEGDQMHFDIISSKFNPIRTTHDTIYNGEEIPEVKGFQTVRLQTAVLSKKNTLSK